MKLRGWFLMALGLVAVFIISIIIGSYIYLRSTVPDYRSSIVAEGIDGEIEIIRDSYGMPHIYATTDSDAAFALGYCLAQDRIFQMDMIRRSVRGRMSEIIGPGVIDVDRLFRTITATKSLSQILEEQPPEVLAQLEAFSAGVNKYLGNEAEKLPFEFALLGYEPEDWQPSDCLTMLYYMAWALNFSFDSEFLYAAVVEKVGENLGSEIFIDYPAGAPTTTTSSSITGTAAGLMELQQKARSLLSVPFRGASNNWVVSGDKSVTGKPLLANDMHLGLALPGIWYEAHVVTPDLNVSGLIIPGTPFVIAGANKQVAWGFTNVMADESDFYIEHLNPDDSNQYRFKDNWEDMDIMYDTIKVRNNEAVSIEIRLTRHGVIVNDLIPVTDTNKIYNQPIAMKWSIADAGKEAQALYLLNRANSIDDIEQAASIFKCPGLNWLYADAEGNTGFTAAASIPIRNGFDGRTLLPGWDGKHEWSGYAPFEKQPHLKNPESGWIATANNKTAGEDYPYYIAHSYAVNDRFSRISSLLQEKDKLSIDDFKKIQADDYLILAEEFVPFIIAGGDDYILDKYEQKALDKMEDWNFRASADEVAPTILHVTYQKTIENVFKDKLGDNLYTYFLQEGTFIIPKSIDNLLKNSYSDWWDNPNTEDKENIFFAINNSFREAVLYLRESLGDDVDDWQWGKLHTLTLYHPIGKSIPIIKAAMNIGPHPMGGGVNSVNAAIYSLADPYEVRAGASQRYIFDLSDINNSLRVIPAGISGNFMSKHYGDQFDLWKNVDYRPFVLDRELVEKDAAYRMGIVPPYSTLDKILID